MGHLGSGCVLTSTTWGSLCNGNGSHGTSNVDAPRLMVIGFVASDRMARSGQERVSRRIRRFPTARHRREGPVCEPVRSVRLGQTLGYAIG